MFLTTIVQLNMGPFDKINVKGRAVSPSPGSGSSPFDVVEVISFRVDGEFSKLEIYVPAGKGEALAAAFREAIS